MKKMLKELWRIGLQTASIEEAEENLKGFIHDMLLESESARNLAAEGKFLDTAITVDHAVGLYDMYKKIMKVFGPHLSEEFEEIHISFENIFKHDMDSVKLSMR